MSMKREAYHASPWAAGATNRTFALSTATRLAFTLSTTFQYGAAYAYKEEIVSKYSRKHIALLLVVCATFTIQPSLAVHAAGPHRIMVPVARGPAGIASAPQPVGDRWSATERQAVDKINAYRREAGCGPLTLHPQLSTAAERHSKDMMAGDFMSHTGSDGSTATQRIREAGYTPFLRIGENIAMGYATADAVVQAWYNSALHKANMLNCQDRDLGMSLEIDTTKQGKYYWTNTFGAK
jgi:uncharacterized protein YkwD